MGGIMITLMHYMPMTWLIIAILLGVFAVSYTHLVTLMVEALWRFVTLMVTFCSPL